MPTAKNSPVQKAHDGSAPNKVLSEHTLELADIMRNAYPKIFRLKSRIDPATKTFQAIRMAVNDEITVLKKGLSGAYELLNIGGRMAVIAFHSGEDRVVKNFMREKVSNKEGVLINK